MELKCCSECRKDLPLDCYHKDSNWKCGYKNKCKDCFRAITRKRYHDGDKVKKKLQKQKPSTKRQSYLRQRNLNLGYKKTAIRRYSNGTMKCAHCDCRNLKALTIDHINNDGGEHRKNEGGANFIGRWLVKNNYPDGFQVLCMNCQTIKKLDYLEKQMNEKHNLTIRKTFKMSWNVQEALNKD